MFTRKVLVCSYTSSLGSTGEAGNSIVAFDRMVWSRVVSVGFHHPHFRAWVRGGGWTDAASGSQRTCRAGHRPSLVH